MLSEPNLYDQLGMYGPMGTLFSRLLAGSKMAALQPRSDTPPSFPAPPIPYIPDSLQHLGKAIFGFLPPSSFLPNAR